MEDENRALFSLLISHLVNGLGGLFSEDKTAFFRFISEKAPFLLQPDESLAFAHSIHVRTMAQEK